MVTRADIPGATGVASMANRVEVRYPFLDEELVEFCSRLNRAGSIGHEDEGPDVTPESEIPNIFAKQSLMSRFVQAACTTQHAIRR